MSVNASAPYVSVHEPLLYSRKNRLIKRQLVDLRYSLCLRGEWLSLSVSFPLCLPVFSPRSSSPALTRLTCLSPSFPRRLSPSSSYRSVSTSGAPLPTFTYHNTQWKNVVSLSNYKIRCECTLHAVHFLRLIAIFFLAAISCAISTQTKNPSKNPLCSKTRDRVSYLFDFYIFITTIYESFVIFDLIKAVVNKSI